MFSEDVVGLVEKTNFQPSSELFSTYNGGKGHSRQRAACVEIEWSTHFPFELLLKR